jgi:transcriptional regulator of nitric oxide reductase
MNMANLYTAYPIKPIATVVKMARKTTITGMPPKRFQGFPIVQIGDG